MRLLTTTLAIISAAVVLAAAPGCGGKAKELPSVVTPSDEKTATPAVVIPTKSEPDALAVVEKAIKAATEGHPERLEKAKVSRVALKGEVIRPSGPMKTERKIEAVWPDRLALADEFTDGGPVKVMMRLRRPVFWIANQREGKIAPVEFPDLKAYETAFAGDAIGRHWMTMLVPLADPKVVVFAAKKETVNGVTADVVKAALPGSPVFTLWFDEKTGLLGRIDFDQLEPGNATPTKKFFGLSNHRPAGGVMIPGKIEYRQNALPLEMWNADSWELPDRLDDTGFDPPK
jgi:hypothetical protein